MMKHLSGGERGERIRRRREFGRGEVVRRARVQTTLGRDGIPEVIDGRDPLALKLVHGTLTPRDVRVGRRVSHDGLAAVFDETPVDVSGISRFVHVIETEVVTQLVREDETWKIVTGGVDRRGQAVVQVGHARPRAVGGHYLSQIEVFVQDGVCIQNRRASRSIHV